MISNNRKEVFLLVLAIMSALLVFHEYASVFGMVGGIISLFGANKVYRKTSSELSFYGIIVSKIAIGFCGFIFVTNVLLVDILAKIIAAVFY